MFEIYPVEYNNTCVNLNILLLGHSWTSLRGRLIRKYTRCRAFIVIPDSDFCTKNNCSIINDERSSPETLRHCRCTVSGRKTASLLRVIVNKRPVIREVFVNVSPAPLVQPMNCERSGNLKPLNETGVGALLRLFLCGTKPRKLVGVVNC